MHFHHMHNHLKTEEALITLRGAALLQHFCGSQQLQQPAACHIHYLRGRLARNTSQAQEVYSLALRQVADLQRARLAAPGLPCTSGLPHVNSCEQPRAVHLACVVFRALPCLSLTALEDITACQQTRPTNPAKHSKLSMDLQSERGKAGRYCLHERKHAYLACVR